MSTLFFLYQVGNKNLKNLTNSPAARKFQENSLTFDIYVKNFHKELTLILEICNLKFTLVIQLNF